MPTKTHRNGRAKSASHHNGHHARREPSWTEKLVSAVGGLFEGIEVEYQSLHDLYCKELQDLYSAEHQLLEALPKMAQAASSAKLREAFESHRKETEGQVKRLKQVFANLGKKPQEDKCKAMAGLVREGDEWINERATPGVKDAGLIAAAQRVEHYEMAGYGCVRTYAELLGDRAAVKLLQETLDEEAAADKKLTQLAKRINVQAESEAEQKAADKRPSHGRRTAGRSRRSPR
jgi:ferritin-like metal-binding protein YciE